MRYYRNYGAKNINLAPIDDLVKVLPTQEQTGKIVTFDSPFAGLPLKSHKIALTATQSGSGTPSPQNIRSINGVSELGINATGKNLLRPNRTTATVDGVTFTVNSDFSVTTSGEYQGRTSNFIYSYLVTLRAGTYILTGCPSGGSYLDYVLRIEDLSAGRIALDTGSGNTFTLTKDQPVFCRIYIYSQNGVGKTFYPMVRMVNTNSDYEPYGTYTTINLGGTYYGGEYDARTGVFVATYKYFSFDYTSSWTHEISGGGHNFYIACPSDIKIGQWAANSNMMCSASPISAYFGAQKDHCFISNARNFNYTWGDTLVISTAQGFKDYLQANNIVIEVVAQLTTPITIQLPPCPIYTLEGVNNIWADTGETTAQYFKK